MLANANYDDNKKAFLDRMGTEGLILKISIFNLIISLYFENKCFKIGNKKLHPIAWWSNSADQSLYVFLCLCAH